LIIVVFTGDPVGTADWEWEAGEDWRDQEEDEGQQLLNQEQPF